MNEPNNVATVEAPTVNENSSISDILSASAKAQEAENPAGSLPDNTQTGEKPSGEDVKTTEPVTKDDYSDIKEGQSIPYERFKKLNEERKELREKIKQAEEIKASQEELESILQDPEIFKAVRTKQGFSKEAIEAELKEMGINPPQKEVEEPNFDLETTDGWKGLIQHEIKKALGQEIAPIKQTLTEQQKEQQAKQLTQRLDNEKLEAEKLCKETYGIEYGNEKDANDPNTGAGKILNYLKGHPEKVELAAQGALSKSDLLHLAMSSESVKLGEKKGEMKEKERQVKLKTAALEGDDSVQTTEYPTADWSAHKIVEWRRKHPNAKI